MYQRAALLFATQEISSGSENVIGASFGAWMSQTEERYALISEVPSSLWVSAGRAPIFSLTRRRQRYHMYASALPTVRQQSKFVKMLRGQDVRNDKFMSTDSCSCQALGLKVSNGFQKQSKRARTQMKQKHPRIFPRRPGDDCRYPEI